MLSDEQFTGAHYTGASLRISTEAAVPEAQLVASAVTAELAAALDRAVAAGVLPASDTPTDIVVEKPKDPSHGDVATNLPMRLARSLGLPPRQVAELLRGQLGAGQIIESAEVAGPGFINMRLAPAWLTAQLAGIIAAGERWGDVDVAGGRSVQVEFVSANPTGPVTFGATRGAAIGDALANVLAAAGHRVEREYYVNDAGSRMHTFSVNCAWFYRRMAGVDEPAPDDAYPAAEHAAELLFAEHGVGLRDLPADELGRHAIAAQLAEIRQDLEQLGCTSTAGSTSRRCSTPVPSTACCNASATPAAWSSATARCGSPPPRSASTRTRC